MLLIKLTNRKTNGWIRKITKVEDLAEQKAQQEDLCRPQWDWKQEDSPRCDGAMTQSSQTNLDRKRWRMLGEAYA